MNLPKKKFLYLFLYIALSALIYIIFISAIAFFHFLIDHSMMDIEAWVFDKNWSIFLFIKLIALYLVYLFLSVKLPAGENILTLLKINTSFPINSILVGVLTLLLMILFIIKPELSKNQAFQLSKVLMSYFCSFFFFSLDAFLVLFIERTVNEKKGNWIQTLLIYTVLISFLNFLSFGTTSNYLPFIVMVHILNFYLILIYDSFRSVIVLNLFLVSPLISFIGLDPVWNTSFSILEPGMRLSWINVTILVAVVTAYWQWCRRNKDKHLTMMV